MSFDATAYTGLRVLVTGASGFIGRWVARSLSAAGADVVLAVRNGQAMHRVARVYGIRGAVVPLQFESESEVESLVADVDPAVTFNLAGYGVDRSERDPETALLVNTLAVDWLARALAGRPRRAGAAQQLVHVGSALEYGAVGGDLREDQPGQPTTLYGRTKLAGTEVLQVSTERDGLRGLTARLFTVYGPGEHEGRLLPSLLAEVEGDRDVPLSAGTQSRDFTYVEDVAEGLLRLGLSTVAPGSIVNLATGRLHTVRTFTEIASDVLGIRRARLRFGALPMRSDEMEHRCVSVARLHAATDWRPATTVADGVRASVAFNRSLDAAAS